MKSKDSLLGRVPRQTNFHEGGDLGFRVLGLGV